MKLVFLGTSAAQPTRKRGLSCLCLEREGEILMFDAGESAQNAYQRAGLGWNKKMRVFITHMHGDHCVGILGLLQTMSMQKRTARLEIFGPEGIEEFVAANIKMLNFGLSFPVMIETVREGKILDSAGYAVMACRAEHTVAAFSYLFEEKNRPGRFDVARAKELKVPEGPLWGRLQGGKRGHGRRAGRKARAGAWREAGGRKDRSIWRYEAHAGIGEVLCRMRLSGV